MVYIKSVVANLGDTQLLFFKFSINFLQKTTQVLKIFIHQRRKWSDVDAKVPTLTHTHSHMLRDPITKPALHHLQGTR